MRRAALALVVSFGFAAGLAQAEYAVTPPDESMGSAKACPRAEAARKEAAAEKQAKKDDKDKPRQWRLEAL